MNKTQLIGRIVREPQIYRNDDGDVTTARYTVAVDRKYHCDEERKEQNADFISCVVFGKGAEFADNYLCKGIKLAIVGRLQTGSYTTEGGQTIYTTDVVVEEQEFVENKAENQARLQKEGKSFEKEEKKASASFPDLNAIFSKDYTDETKTKSKARTNK